jgi:hypothetical protein
MEIHFKCGKPRALQLGAYVLRGIMKNAKVVQVSLQRGTGPFSVRLGGCWLYLEVTINEYIFNCNAVR